VNKLGIVIVNRNAKALLRDCLRSVRAGTASLSSEVIVVDNASSDGSPDMVRGEFPNAVLIRADANLGFAAANNIALRRILERGESEYVLLLNSDTVVPSGGLEALAGYLDSHPGAAGAAPALVFPDGRFQSGTGGSLPSALSGLYYFFFLSKLLPKHFRGLFFDQAALARASKDSFDGIPVEWLSGACLMLRLEVLEKTGLLDERYFFYAEDIDWGRRMTQAGRRLFYLPWIRVVHHQGSSYELSGVNTLWLRTLYTYVRKETGPGQYILFRLFSILGFSLRMALYSLALVFGNGPGRKKIREITCFLIFSLWGRLEQISP